MTWQCCRCSFRNTEDWFSCTNCMGSGMSIAYNAFFKKETLETITIELPKTTVKEEKHETEEL